MVTAENVSLKNCFLVGNENLTFTKTRITKIEVVKEMGIYSPLTMSGNIFVNDIFASCYSNINIPQLHSLLSGLIKQQQKMVSAAYIPELINRTEIDLIPGFSTFTDIIKYYVLPSNCALTDI